MTATPDPATMTDREQLLATQVVELKRWVADLQSGMYVNCVYCGHRYGPGMTTPVAMADALKAHIAQCPQHPMAHLVKACTAASHALKSYAFGNSAPDLASSTASYIDAVLAYANRPGASPPEASP